MLYVILGAILLMVDIDTSTAPPTVECLENGLAICYQQVLAHYQALDVVTRNKIDALQRHANTWTGSIMSDFTEHLGVLGDIFRQYKAGGGGVDALCAIEKSLRDEALPVFLRLITATGPTAPPPELTDEDKTKVLKGKMVRLATDAEVPHTGYSTAGGYFMLPDAEDIDSLSPGKWMTNGALASLITSMQVEWCGGGAKITVSGPQHTVDCGCVHLQFYAPSSYVGPRPELLPVEWANELSPIFDSNAPMPVPLESWQRMLAYLVAMNRVEQIDAAACIIVPVHHNNHYFFVVYFRQVKRVVFFDSGERFNPSWPTQLMMDTFTELGDHCFSDDMEGYVFEKGTITQQPDGIHCADFTLSGINALLQAANLRYWQNIDLAHINMASQRLRWLQPFLAVTVERMTAEQARDQAGNADDMEATVVEGAGTAAPLDVVAAEL
ncbi:hypothetical protein HaLaN_21857 [Haematococcus lacustris]|uniref:Ubiquitin-like protease family profile domain-containing protein n=1 Tax=Haematococcus lacustris TaxID=44745 RepID=A0A699ZQA5_HAELA|nr:hypothetical protein HaLaN_21857 [Haematococcus lacustris]